ncbi:SDR family oxidoreductase [soil metagenome]
MSETIHFFAFGLGYSAAAIARALKKDAAWIGGTVRNVEKAVALAGEGLNALIFDGKAAGVGVAEGVRHATHLLVSVPPGAADPVLAVHRDSILAAEHLRWIGYLSTVGVYGNYGGAWVTEATTPHPTPGRSTERLAAERAWKAVAEERKLPLAIFRLAGIYGPGRNAFTGLADGTARRIVKPGQVFNRIHVDDIAQTAVAAIAANAEGVFNVTDDEPAPAADVTAFAAGLMGVAPPPEVPIEAAELSPMARSFYAENKRVANRRIKEELGVTLRYRTYREGLTALWREGTWR